jgi:hypothetical protein
MIDGITQRVANSEPWIARAAHLIRRDDDRFGSEATFSTMSLTPSLATAKTKMAHLALCHLCRCCLAAKLQVAMTLPPIEMVCVEPPALAERF